MSPFFKISEAVSIAFQTAAYLASMQPVNLSAQQIAANLGLSKAHLSKILQKMVKSGIIRSMRGPGGGYSLALEPGQATLMDVYTALEGPYRPTTCPAGGEGSLFACAAQNLITILDRNVIQYLSNTTLADLTDSHKADHAGCWPSQACAVPAN